MRPGTRLEAKSFPLTIRTASVEFLADAEQGTPWWPVLECIQSFHTGNQANAALFGRCDSREYLFLVIRHDDGRIETAEMAAAVGLQLQGFSTRYTCFSSFKEVVAGLEALRLSPSELVALLSWGAGKGG